MADSVGVHLFSCGWEFECWTERNCDRCVKVEGCDLVEAIFLDALTHGLPSGNVTQETADRLGYTAEYVGVLGWPCAERQTEDAPPMPTPAAAEMAKAGAAMLPGFDDAPSAGAGVAGAVAP